MKKVVWAVLFHNCDISDENIRHQFCPLEENSWCMWQADKFTGKHTYKKKLSLPLAIKKVLTPMFVDLSDGSLLSKCLHGQTQNNNECLNGVIWKKCPKDIFVSRKTLEMGVNSAIIEFNDGRCGLEPVFKNLGINVGHFMRKRFEKHDLERIRVMEKKSSQIGKKHKKKT